MDHVEYKLLAKTYERMHDAWLKDGMYDYWDDSDDDNL